MKNHRISLEPNGPGRRSDSMNDWRDISSHMFHFHWGCSYPWFQHFASTCLVYGYVLGCHIPGSIQDCYPANVKHSSYLKGDKRLLIMSQMWLTTAEEQGSRKLQITCSNMEAVKWTLIVTEQNKLLSIHF